MMRAQRNATILGALIATLGGAPTVVAAQSDPYEQAVGQVTAAIEIYTHCDGLGPNGPEDVQGFVMAATDLLAQQGLRRQKMRKLLFYGQTTWIEEMGAAVLADRGVNAENRKALCSFGRKVAGKNDTIGRFLVKE